MLTRSVQFIKGIGPKKAVVLSSEAGIETVEDLLYYAPRKYLDRSNLKSIKDCFTGDTVTVGGIIKKANVTGRNKKYLEVVIDDGTDSISGIFFRGLAYFKKALSPGEYVLFSGKVDYFRTKQIVHPDYDFIDEDSSVKSIHTGRVIPLYRSGEKLKSCGFDSRGFRRVLRTVIDNYLQHVTDPLPEEIKKNNHLLPLKEALFSLHFPDTLQEAEMARRRLSFNELFYLQLYLGFSRKMTGKHASIERKQRDVDYVTSFINSLPFTLTRDQEKCIREIQENMSGPAPMNRLLQGDVGSGKTVVAIAAALICLEQGKQCVIMAPTEILAQQHYETFLKFLPAGVNTGILTGSSTTAERENLLARSANGELDVVIGTHALLEDEVKLKNPGLVVIDEQHRFGVNQRTRLRAKGDSTDLLVMTATPIPRSLALTLYGDLDVSSLHERPANRSTIKTMAFPQSRIKGVYNSIDKYISEKRQVYYVLPLIEESEKLDLKSAIQSYEHLKNEIFPHRRIDLLHGRMSAKEKDNAMSRFYNGETDILVSTTVIEVGIDVPNATVMVIEHAERFGLSQLHQLRGRVGRSIHRSFCVLIHPDDVSEEGMKRIHTLVAIDDGFKIAEEDLKLRGSGEIIGYRQHGHSSGFEFVDLSTDFDLITSARIEAMKEIDSLAAAPGNNAVALNTSNLPPAFNGIRSRRVLSILS